MEDAGKRFWQDVWPLILKSPVALFAGVATLLLGYGISFVLFDYRTNSKGYSHIIHIFLGVGYACIMFALTSWNVLFGKKPPTLDDLAIYCPRTIVISFATLVIAIIAVTIVRDRRVAKGG